MSKSRTFYISLGSNLGDSTELIKKAIERIEDELGSIIMVSSLYETAPWGFESEFNFVNAMISVKTDISPELAMHMLLDIEEKMGRKRDDSGIYKNRMIDLDIIAVDDLVFTSDDLIIPHPKMQFRAFVLIPFAEIAPDWQHPLLKKGLNEMQRLLIHKEKVNRLKI